MYFDGQKNDVICLPVVMIPAVHIDRKERSHSLCRVETTEHGCKDHSQHSRHVQECRSRLSGWSVVSAASVTSLLARPFTVLYFVCRWLNVLILPAVAHLEMWPTGGDSTAAVHYAAADGRGDAGGPATASVPVGLASVPRSVHGQGCAAPPRPSVAAAGASASPSRPPAMWDPRGWGRGRRGRRRPACARAGGGGGAAEDARRPRVAAT